jgi:hypothetical protein
MHGDTVGAKSLPVSVPPYRINRKKGTAKTLLVGIPMQQQKRFLATMSSGDDRSGLEGPNDKTSNSNNLNTVTKSNIYTGFVLPQYRDDPYEIVALGIQALHVRQQHQQHNTTTTPTTPLGPWGSSRSYATDL